MQFSVAFLNCGPRPDRKRSEDWATVASILHQAIGDHLSILGLCEVYDNNDVPEIVSALRDETHEKYESLFSPPNPPGPRLGVVVNASLGRLQLVGDDRSFRHGKDWKHWLAGRVEFFRPGTSKISSRQLVVVVNHWDSMKRGMRDTMANREILAW